MKNGPEFPAEKLIKYPHMFPLDIVIWERFLDTYSGDFSGFTYDVKVGSGTKPIKGLGSNYERMQQILSKYRVDVVGYKPNAIYIIETKPEAGTIAIGQIEAYTRLYLRDFKPQLPIIGMIVTDRELPDMRYLTSQKKIEYYIV
jgi:hypothetical protein